MLQTHRTINKKCGHKGLSFGFAFLLVLAFFLAAPVFAQSGSSPALPPLTYDETMVNRIEALSIKDLDEAKERAQSLKGHIEREIWPYRSLIDQKQDQVRQYRDLENSAKENAEKNRGRAERSLQESKDPVFDEAYQASLRRDAEQWEQEALRDDQRAQEYRGKASEIERDAQELLDEIAVGRELIARLDAILNKTEEEDTEEPAAESDTSQTQADQPASGDDADPLEDTPEFGLDDVVGLWTYTEDGGGHFAIVPQFSSDEPSATDAYLEAHTKDGRVWKGAMYARISPGDPLLEFTYKPTAEEMNEDIPDWARREIEGDLEWVLRIDEAGDIVNPRLRVKFFPRRGAVAGR